jgi:hypothetical protein
MIIWIRKLTIHSISSKEIKILVYKKRKNASFFFISKFRNWIEMIKSNVLQDKTISSNKYI